MPPPLAVGSYTRGSNLRSASSFSFRASASIAVIGSHPTTTSNCKMPLSSLRIMSIVPAYLFPSIFYLSYPNYDPTTSPWRTWS
ncbi:hypothetical protein Zm00014a_026946 [Zea mays]|uniref:Uncharacterized protein n=1 Tax=Zea mays TaxID=4577 RepID=A0A3L6FEL2_MAIZE|nr:hypothetical protein Zm00014a_026946 [Zea mays]